jgi:hypothetical protein
MPSRKASGLDRLAYGSTRWNCLAARPTARGAARLLASWTGGFGSYAHSKADVALGDVEGGGGSAHDHGGGDKEGSKDVLHVCFWEYV